MSDLSKKTLLILLHGVGANGADLEPLGGLLAAQIPGLLIESPNAPHRSEIGPGFQWFSVAGVTLDNRFGRVVAARPAFDALVASLIEKHGMTKNLDRVFFLGFSQGSIMGLDAVVSGRCPIAALIAFSGRLATHDVDRSVKVPVLLQHGAADTVIPASETLATERKLKEVGIPVESHIFTGLGHTISQDGLTIAKRFIEKILSEKQ